MLKIIKIEKLKMKYKIDFENEKSIYILEDTLIKFNIFKSKEITKKTYEEILNYNTLEERFNNSVNYLSYGLRSEYELKEYIIKKQKEKNLSPLTDNDINKILLKLKSLDYINDDRYTKLATESYFNLKKKGPKWIKKKLFEKRIEESVINKHLKIICTTEKINDNIYNVIETSYPKLLYPKAKKIQKIKEKLFNNGYPLSNINEMFDIFFEDYIEEDNDDLLEREFNKIVEKFSKKYEDSYTLKRKLTEKLTRSGFGYYEVKDFLENKEW